MELCRKFSELDRLCPIKLMLISEITPFMFIVTKKRGAHHGQKWQCVSVLAYMNTNSNHFTKVM